MSPTHHLSDTARTILTAAAERADHLAKPPERLPVAAQRSVVQSLLKNGLIEEVAADDDQPPWRTTESGERLALRLTAVGQREFRAGATAALAGSTQQTMDPPYEAPSASGEDARHNDAPGNTSHAGSRSLLRAAAIATLAAWDDADAGRQAMPEAVARLRAALTPSMAARHVPGLSRQPRSDTKRSQVLTLLRRPEGATVAQIANATGWATHTVRGFLAALKKAGTPVEVLSRVRQVGPGKEGAKGSYTVYCIADAS